MSFLHPEFLYYMLPPLFILFALLLTQKEVSEQFFSQEVMDRLRVHSNTLTPKARNALFFLIGFLIIIALAQPVIKEAKTLIKAKSADIMIALDISDSMLAEDVYPKRLESAKRKALAFLKEAKDERVGVVAFAKDSYLVSPLSFDKHSVSFLLEQLDTTSITEQGSDFLSVIGAVEKIQKDEKKKVLLILSDGGDKSDFSEEIALAKKSGITIFILGIATKQGAPIKREDGTFIKYNDEIIISKLNENIASLATKTGGVYIESTTSLEDIKRVIKEIERVGEKKELKSQEIQKSEPLFYYPLSLALLLLLIAMSSFGRKNSLHVSVFLLLALSLHQDAQAGIFDFMDLKKAKEAYNGANYEESAKLYDEYAQKSKSPQSYYNSANAYYKQQKYKEAIEAYNKATFDDESQRAKKLSNLGNAYAKDGDLQKAIDSYKESLKIEDDKETRENLSEVEKFLKEQEQKKEQENQQNKDKNREEKDKQEEKEDKQKESSKEKNQDKDQSKEEKKDSKEQSDKEQEENDKKAKEQEAKESQKGESKDDLKDKDSHVSDKKESQMSEAEEQKWINQLKQNSSSYLYKLSDDEKKLSKDEKPW
ncbi:von Willebrand factor, type A [Sulfurimonas denitrificans DSM 1251]|uniref:von Willebrand factor, type A n=1 Tax=Sulfurimonas denitrificans (strain ATCC 33889 / DSM 1251) TaxID=326298 RepID=Q30SU5_SULDN|nr:VWA domain-containing protein [Sulfurimonas denitrificans]ABB43936.1 von Willebrand factor, type A [Sulfurimonas denitrificans DSM 1251]